MSDKEFDSLLLENRKARHDYQILETFEVGIVLRGTEVKSCRMRKANINDAYAAFRGSELWLQQAQINEYTHGNRTNHDPKRSRKLLMHRHELNKLLGRLQTTETMVPLKMYIKNRKIKLLMGMAKGKKAHDKRQDLKKREADREMARAFRR